MILPQHRPSQRPEGRRGENIEAEEKAYVPGPAERAFNDGWQAYKTGRLEDAVRHFRDAYRTDIRSKFSEDAMFWECVILDRRGDDGAASTALGRFLSAYPASRRQGEASAMLGWKMLKLGRRNEAERLFKRALESPSAKVRRSADRGLREIANQQ